MLAIIGYIYRIIGYNTCVVPQVFHTCVVSCIFMNVTFMKVRHDLIFKTPLFLPPCLVCMDTHEYNIEGQMTSAPMSRVGAAAAASSTHTLHSSMHPPTQDYVLRQVMLALTTFGVFCSIRLGSTCVFPSSCPVNAAVISKRTRTSHDAHPYSGGSRVSNAGRRAEVGSLSYCVPPHSDFRISNQYHV